MNNAKLIEVGQAFLAEHPVGAVLTGMQLLRWAEARGGGSYLESDLLIDRVSLRLSAIRRHLNATGASRDLPEANRFCVGFTDRSRTNFVVRNLRLPLAAGEKRQRRLRPAPLLDLLNAAPPPADQHSGDVAEGSPCDGSQPDENMLLMLRAAVKTAGRAAGSMSELARVLGLSSAAIAQWKRIPAERIVEIERATGVRREVLRPDLYQGPTLINALAIVRAEGYRVVKPRTSKHFRRPKPKDRVGPTFVCEFADGTRTRMSVFSSLENLDWGRGERLSIAAYQSRWRMRALAQYHKQNGGLRLTRWQYRESAINLIAPVPPAIIAAHFEQDGQMLAQRTNGSAP
jgi:DNA-binding transcriptional regulator YdaS (Cro superfamily)